MFCFCLSDNPNLCIPRPRRKLIWEKVFPFEWVLEWITISNRTKSSLKWRSEQKNPKEARSRRRRKAKGHFLQSLLFQPAGKNMWAPEVRERRKAPFYARDLAHCFSACFFACFCCCFIPYPSFPSQYIHTKWGIWRLCFWPSSPYWKQHNFVSNNYNIVHSTFSSVSYVSLKQYLCLPIEKVIIALFSETLKAEIHTE